MSDILTFSYTLGIGRGLVFALLLRPRTTVVAAVRDTACPTSQSLVSASKASGSRLVVVKIDSSLASDPHKAFVELTEGYGIDQLDVLIANAGINVGMTKVLDTTAEQMRDTYEVNTIAPLFLFQAGWPLLQKSLNPKFVAVSSDMASIGEMVEAPGLAYGMSKAALDYLVKKIHVEHEGVTAVALHPG